MVFDGLTKDIPGFDYTRILNAVCNMDPNLWLQDTHRQNSYWMHGDTQTLRIIWLDNSWPATKVPQPENYFNGDSEVVESCLELSRFLEKHYQGTTLKLIVSKLIAGGKILEHWDKSLCFQSAHRNHLPIITNSQVNFYLNGIKNNFLAGNLFEINNQVMHYVENDSNEDRIHIICDVIENETLNNIKKFIPRKTDYKG